MNVLIIPTWYPIGYDKLMGIYHKEFCEALAKRKNINVNILYIDKQMLKHPFKYIFMRKNDIIEEENYTVYIKRMLNRSKISEVWQLKKYTKKLEQAFLEYLKENPKPDILHAQVTLPAGYATCVIGKKYNIPVVVTEHASYYQEFFNGKNRPYTDYVLKYAYFTSVSKYMLKDIPQSTKQAVLPNLVDTKMFEYNRKKIPGLRIVKVCAFRKGKRVEDLLSALKIIVDEKKIDDVHLTIVGEGYLKDFYKKITRELELEKYVNFVGQKSKKEVAQILKEHNMCVITSNKETFCIPAIEALASGMPVVSTKCFGPEEYLDEKCGKLVEVGDIQALAQAITEVYQNIDNYDVNYLRSVANRFSSTAVTNQAISIYKELINEKNKK